MIDSDRVTKVKDSQESKTHDSRVLTVLGIIRDFNELAAKAPLQIVVNEAGSSMERRDLHPKNTPVPIDNRVDGN